MNQTGDNGAITVHIFTNNKHYTKNSAISLKKKTKKRDGVSSQRRRISCQRVAAE